MITRMPAPLQSGLPGLRAKKSLLSEKISFSGTRASLRVTTPNSPEPHGADLINYG